MRPKVYSTIKRFVLLLAALIPLSTHATLFYVDPLATGANNGTSWGSAWTSFAAVNWGGTHPGDTVFVSGGTLGQTYTEEPITIGAGGSLGNQLTVQVGQDAGHNGPVTFDGNHVDCAGHSYITLSGKFGNVSHLSLINFNSQIERTWGNKVVADGTTGFVMEYCTADRVNQGVSLVGASGFTVRYCDLLCQGDACIRAVNCSGGFDANLIEHNFIRPARYVGTDTSQPWLGPDGIQGSHGLTIRYNTFACTNVTYLTSTQHPDYTQIIGNYLKIYGNLFLNIGDSGNDFDWIFNPTPHDILIYNNIYNIVQAMDPFPEYIRWYVSGGKSITSISNFQIVNNVFANNTGWAAILATWGASGNPSVSGFRVANNIFFHSAFSIANNPALTGSSMTWSNNVYDPGMVNTWRGTNYSAANFVAQIDPTGIAGVPTFVGPANFHLASTNSVGWNAALNYSSLFTTDFDGTTRTTWDDGAFAFITSGSQPPNTPSNSSPINGASGVGLTPTLATSSYSDPLGNPQIGAEFNVYAADGITPVTGSGTLSAVTTWPIPGATLTNLTVYQWNARHQNSLGLWSSFSPKTSFTTITNSSANPILSGLSWPAPTGVIVPPFTVSGGAVFQSVTTTDPLAGGRASYTFTNAPGVYTVKLHINAPGDGNNSVFIDFNQEPTDPTTIWDVQLFTTGFEDRLASWRGNGAFNAPQFPQKTWTLPGGTNTLIIRGRENGTLFDFVTVLLPAGTLPPNQPTNVAPVFQASDVAQAALLVGSAYSDPASSPQTAAQFRVYAQDQSTLIWDSGTVPGAVASTTTPTLGLYTIYYWQVRYQNSVPLWSDYSPLTPYLTRAGVIVRMKSGRSNQITIR